MRKINYGLMAMLAVLLFATTAAGTQIARPTTVPIMSCSRIR